MKKTNASNIVAVATEVLGQAWTTYKRTAARRHQPQSLFDVIFGREMTDVEAAAAFVKDVTEIHQRVQTRKFDRKFENIVKHY